MATPNRLGREKSPYLLAHAGNPVDWYPWGPEAFAAARARDVPLFVSIGYSACHWCHVMERECFEDGQVARLMNEHLVAVKIDREELPAVDHLFMAYCQGMTGGGGWPLTVVLTPAGKPFFAGTYFPRESAVGRPGMLDLAPLLGRLWREQREQVLRTADELERALAAQLEPAPGALPGPGLVDETARELFRLYDPRWGGFGAAPKFPTVPWLLFLLRYAERQGGDGGRARVVVEETLRAMRLGGIYDHLGHGFHRYSTDAGWLLPHFEKMLYDQALLALAYTEAHRLWGEAAFRRTAEETLAYVLRDLRAPAGGFAAAEDADSEGEEGRFYLWSLDEVTAVLGPAAADEFAAAFHLRAGGNFTSEVGERSERNILHRISPLAISASDFTLPVDLPEGLAASRASLLAAREKRVRPRRDDKVLADWNGLAIAALAKAAAVFAEPRYAGEAARAADFVLGKLRDAEGNLLHRWRDGEAACPGVVDDYADLAWGLIELHGATGERRWLDEALRLADALEGRFGDGAGGLFFAPPDPLLPLRQRIAVDAALPAGAAVAAEVLVRLGAATGEPSHAERARRLIRAFGGDIERAPLGCAHLLSASMLLGEAAS